MQTCRQYRTCRQAPSSRPPRACGHCASTASQYGLLVSEALEYKQAQLDSVLNMVFSAPEGCRADVVEQGVICQVTQPCIHQGHMTFVNFYMLGDMAYFLILH